MSADIHMIDSAESARELQLDDFPPQEYKFLRHGNKFVVFPSGLTHQAISQEVDITDLLTEELRSALALASISVVTLYDVIKSVPARRILTPHMDAGYMGKNIGGVFVVQHEGTSVKLPTRKEARTVFTSNLIAEYFQHLAQSNRDVRIGTVYSTDVVPRDF